MLTQQFQFFQTLIALSETLVSSQPTPSALNFAKFRDFVLEKQGKNVETIKLLAPYFLHYLCKPQKLLYDHAEFYIANDYLTNTYAICMRDLTMIDVDADECTHGDAKGEIDQEKVLNFCSNYLKWLIQECETHRDWRLGIYRSRKGLHIFALHTVFEREARATFQLQLKCDFYYTLYTYLRQGCSIRLNVKHGETLPLYYFVGFLGHGQANQRLVDLMHFHARLPRLFQGLGPSGMK